MEFVIDNYMWFSIGGIVLLMTLIGYVADKSNYMEKQKAKDLKKKNEYETKKKTHLTYGKKAFNKEIGNGDNLVLEEDLLTYPVEFDRKPVEIIIPTQEKVVEEVVADLKSSTLSDIDVNSENVDTTNNQEVTQEVLEEVTEEPVTPLEENVESEVTDETTKKEDDIWNF